MIPGRRWGFGSPCAISTGLRFEYRHPQVCHAIRVWRRANHPGAISEPDLDLKVITDAGDAYANIDELDAGLVKRERPPATRL